MSGPGDGSSTESSGDERQPGGERSDAERSDGPQSNGPQSESPDEGAPFDPDSERAERLRTIADEIRGETSESKQLANILYRTSDLYDEDEETNPEEIVRNVKFILEVTERGGLGR